MQYEFKYADLLDDDVFKLVFGQESSKDVMIEFLNQVIDDRTIVDLEFMDKEMKSEDRKKKDSTYMLLPNPFWKQPWKKWDTAAFIMRKSKFRMERSC